MEKPYALLLISVEGIQAYLTATGKLKEMIGASYLTASFPDEVLKYCKEKEHLSEFERPQDNNTWFVLLQNGAGVLRMVVPTREIAKRVVSQISKWSIDVCPGLPLYAAVEDCAWTYKSVKEAAEKASTSIAKKREENPKPPRTMWPFCRLAPLDGLPAVTRDTGQSARFLSIVSVGRSKPKVLEKAREKFSSKEQMFRQPYTDYTGKVHPAIFPDKDIHFEWADDIDKMLATSPIKKIALLHMDGNDLGVRFRKEIEKYSPKTEQENTAEPLEKMTRAMRKLSDLVDTANTYACEQALLAIVAEDVDNNKNKIQSNDTYTIPARLLVLGGDDLTVIVQAQLAFTFVDVYAAAFSAYTTKEKNRMSVGGGMVIVPSGYMFSRAFAMVEELTSNAKRLTCGKTKDEVNDEGFAAKRKSSLDYFVVTNDIEQDVTTLRKKSYVSRDGAYLTGKPFFCGLPTDPEDPRSLSNVLENARSIHEIFPSGKFRNAIDACRNGVSTGKKAFDKLRENFTNGLGMTKERGKEASSKLKALFPDDNFFFKDRDGQLRTLLGDYLELRRILYPTEEA